jgi:hypothetical protein
MELGDVDAWIGVLDQLKDLHSRHIHPGRGYESGADLLDKQIEYLRFVKSVVESYKPRGEIPGKVKEEIVERIKDKYAGYDNEYFLQLGIPAVWKHLALRPGG